MKKFTPGDLKRLQNQFNLLKEVLDTDSAEDGVKDLFKEIGEVLEAHEEIVERYSRVRAKKNALGRQLNHVNDRLREVKKANKTLTDKAHGRQAVSIDIEATDAEQVNNNVVIDAPSSVRGCCRGS